MGFEATRVLEDRVGEKEPAAVHTGELFELGWALHGAASLQELAFGRSCQRWWQVTLIACKVTISSHLFPPSGPERTDGSRLVGFITGIPANIQAGGLFDIFIGLTSRFLGTLGLWQTGFRQSCPDGRNQLPLRAQEVALQKVGSSSYQGAEETHVATPCIDCAS